MGLGVPYEEQGKPRLSMFPCLGYHSTWRSRHWSSMGSLHSWARLTGSPAPFWGVKRGLVMPRCPKRPNIHPTWAQIIFGFITLTLILRLPNFFTFLWFPDSSKWWSPPAGSVSLCSHPHSSSHLNCFTQTILLSNINKDRPVAFFLSHFWHFYSTWNDSSFLEEKIILLYPWLKFNIT